MFENMKVFETELAGRKLSVETGRLAGLANASVLMKYGDTVVLTAVTASKSPREGIDYFPLSVDYEEKLYAVGRIPGSFMRREGRPSEKAILASRVIDRPIRPLFPKDMRNDVSVVNTVLSVDPDCQPEPLAMLGSSVAIAISDVPWNVPIGAVAVGYINGEYIINPTAEERKVSDMYVTVAATAYKVVMIEAGANCVSDEVMIGGINCGFEECQKLVEFINKITAEIGKEKFDFEHIVVDEAMFEDIKSFAIEAVRAAMDTDDKNVRDANLKIVYDNVYAQFEEKYPDSKAQMDECLYKLQKFVVRRWLLDDGKRVDGRGIDEMRPLNAQVGILPRTHGSGLFTRGQTQVLTVATLGTVSEAQILDGIDEEEEKRYLHHYNFPSYSVGETRPSRGPGRREIGHGALAGKALEPVLPTQEEFPYVIRLVSEVLSSNGSTSQASICGSTLALMDAGVPIIEPVAGISCGLVTEGDRWMTMVDIQGVEDFFGDMDFKVAGTHDGITAIQMDLKNDGLTPEIIRSAIEKTHKARNYILDEVMLKTIDKPREELSPYAPKMITMQIDVDKIREVIGSGGKVIQKIVADTGAKIDIEDDGRVFITAIDSKAAAHAKSIIDGIVNDPEVGALYSGTVTRLMTFGAFVEIAPGKEGMVHISQYDRERVEKMEDVATVGDEIMVKVVEIDSQGRINLSRKAVLDEMDGIEKPIEAYISKPKPSGDRNGRPNGDRRNNSGGRR